MGALIDHALKLADKGLAVFPIVPREKRPATPNGLKDASKDPAIIRDWWRDMPDANIGIATGAISGIFVTDIDGLDGQAELSKIEATHGALPATVEAITARGRHCYFQMPAHTVRNSAGRIGQGIDIRGDGGYVLAPPSMHPSGRRYAWSVDSGKTIAPAPAWLLDKVSEHHSGNGRAAAAPEEWIGLIGDGVGEGQRDCTATRLAGHLLRRFIHPFVALELIRAWNTARCRPPLPDEDIERIVNSIAAIELKRRGN